MPNNDEDVSFGGFCYRGVVAARRAAQRSLRFEALRIRLRVASARRAAKRLQEIFLNLREPGPASHLYVAQDSCEAVALRVTEKHQRKGATHPRARLGNGFDRFCRQHDVVTVAPGRN